jgi:hypothetical protein
VFRVEGCGGPTLDWLRGFVTPLTASLSDGRVWLSFVIALLLGSACLVLGTWAARRVGLLDRSAPVGETLGVGLGSGLLMFAAGWAAIASVGRSSFTPIALAFVIAIVLEHRFRNSRPKENVRADRQPRISTFRAAIVAAAFVVAIGLIYGSTMSPSPRDGAQPVEHGDEAYYSALAIDLNRSGTESPTFQSGFDSIPGFPTQNWYHWGEMWISAAVIRASGLDPVLARHYVVLPLLLLAAASLTGTLVRRIARSSSRLAFLFGAAACLLLAPLPLVPGDLTGWWAVGLLFGISQYGLAVVAALLSLQVIAINEARRSSAGFWLFSGTIMASLLPAHVVVAVLALVEGAAVSFMAVVLALLRRRRPSIPEHWRGVIACVAVVGVATAAWGALTGHELRAIGTSAIVAPYNRVWLETVAYTALAAGALLAVPFAGWATRTTSDGRAPLFIGTALLVAWGAIAWGARIADFDSFHIFFGAIAVFGTPVAAAAIWTLWMHLRTAGRARFAAALLILCAVQVEAGILPAMARLQQFGTSRYQPIPLEILATIRGLPTDAKLAYACRTDEEFTFWVPRLGSIYAHTGRRVVPLCFELDRSSAMIGADPSIQNENLVFRFAPQAVLFSDVTASPSSASVSAFLKEHDIGYIYADADHPNVLVPEAQPIASRDGVVVLAVP